MLKKILLGGIRFYRNAVSPWTPPSCRYVPTCSEYAEEAVRRHGPARGAWLAARRVLRCHPFGGHGPDPVPPAPDPSAPSRRAPSSHSLSDARAGAGSRPGDPVGAAGGER